MESNHTYSIVVENKTAEKKKNPVAGNSTSTKHSSGGPDYQDLGKKGLVSFKTFIQSFVEQVPTSYVNTISLRTGAEEHQERMEFAQSVIRRGVGIVESIAMGALVGGGIGAAIGTVTSLATTAVSYVIKYQEMNIKQQTENASLSAMFVRAGGAASFSGSRERRQ